MWTSLGFAAPGLEWSRSASDGPALGLHLMRFGARVLKNVEVIGGIRPADGPMEEVAVAAS
ncbi:MAG TPA: hypothetical protein VH458_23590 [Vicinamibacterales bacterium]|jgi:hypothetical protein